MDKRKEENLLDPLKKDADERKENMEEEEVAEEREEEAARAGAEERAGDDIEGRDAEMKETEVKQEEGGKEDKVVDGKRHEKEAKVIQKQSKRIKELEVSPTLPLFLPDVACFKDSGSCIERNVYIMCMCLCYF